MKQHGFTLTELMITIAVAAIVLAIGVPSFQQVVRNNQATSQMNDLIGSLSLARSEAVKRGRRVVMCKSNDGATCSGNWHDGWIVFVDDANENATPDAGEDILRVHGPLGGASDNTLTGNALVNTFISYTPDGFPRNLSGSLFSSDGEFTFGLSSGSGNHVVAVSPTGRTTVK
ncbi:MAG TPA: GspH/FimT family pseudopilin [Candidatus Competibacteraceae bacterium]|mgnify:CR=1 FL=1|nr:GspH/FimT family pseudopilin [Candidatus Competibacteraceae bacterium]